MTDREITPKALRAARKTLGLTQFQLAIRLRCAYQTVTTWEQGRAHPAGEYEERVLAFLAEADRRNQAAACPHGTGD